MAEFKLLKWLETATKEEMMEKASTADPHRAIIIYENVTLGNQCSREMQALADLRRTILLVGLDENFGKHKLEFAVRINRKVLSATHPDMIAAKALLDRVLPPDPDQVLLQSHLDQINDFYDELTGDKDAKLRELVSPQWQTLFDVFRFDAHVQWEAMHGYFANTLGEDKEKVEKAFTAVNENLGTLVKNAFEVFDKHKEAHEKSRADRADMEEFTVAPTGEMPGYLSSAGADDDEDDEDEDDNPYEQVESAYIKAAEDLNAHLIKFIKKNQDKMPPLVELEK